MAYRNAYSSLLGGGGQAAPRVRTAKSPAPKTRPGPRGTSLTAPKPLPGPRNTSLIPKKPGAPDWSRNAVMAPSHYKAALEEWRAANPEQAGQQAGGLQKTPSIRANVPPGQPQYGELQRSPPVLQHGGMTAGGGSQGMDIDRLKNQLAGVADNTASTPSGKVNKVPGPGMDKTYLWNNSRWNPGAPTTDASLPDPASQYSQQYSNPLPIFPENYTNLSVRDRLERTPIGIGGEPLGRGGIAFGQGWGSPVGGKAPSLMRS